LLRVAKEFLVRLRETRKKEIPKWFCGGLSSSSDEDNWMVWQWLWTWGATQNKKWTAKFWIWFGILLLGLKTDWFLRWIKNSATSWVHLGRAEVQSSNVKRSGGNVVDLSREFCVAVFRVGGLNFCWWWVANVVVVDRAGIESAAKIVARSFAHFHFEKIGNLSLDLFLVAFSRQNRRKHLKWFNSAQASNWQG
jgi:hypothetical protein